jgi:hypothetical protein
MSDLGPSGDGRVKAGTISVPVSRGGCGEQHTAFVNEDGRVCIKCPSCAPVMVGSHHGWAATPAGVPLTPDEQGEVQVAEREGQVAMRMAMKAMGDTVGRMVQGDGKAAKAEPVLNASTLAAQLATMTAAERAEIASLLAPGGVLPVPHPDTPAVGRVIPEPVKAAVPAKVPARAGRPAKAS